MKESNVILTAMPQADGNVEQRPALILRDMPPFGDMLVCGVSTQLHQYVRGVSVFDHILQRVRQKIRALDYVMTLHAEEEMEDDDISILGVEHAILTGEIIERQPDQETGEWKYLIAGNTLADDPIIDVAKLALTGTLVIITVYRDE